MQSRRMSSASNLFAWPNTLVSSPELGPLGHWYNQDMENLDEITRQVLDLPLDQRSELAEKLLESLDELAPEEIEQVWAAEAERRYQAFKDGTIEAVDGSAVHREIIADLK